MIPISIATHLIARRSNLLRLACILPIAFCVHAQPANIDSARFDNAQPALERFIAKVEPRPSGDQNFCVVTYPSSDGYAWVHWLQGNKLIYWLGAAGEPPDDTLVFSTRKLDLTKDVVEYDRDISGSTYLVSRKWVRDRLADCQARGKRYVIRGF
ncbi:hypothetical protein FXN63_11110 [Pigmentiphaga aceris]|uniref:Lipoprotein n=1 Tax=Pigmentiphaga aceris TaxID=1940612 RepID=A0A5C0B0Z9_9BURK|nr:hypothetical protein [Pigmentiphaga aceris]QEI06317.1 hypothetical protein FXN63_11110 [Pigmentiphaga aceris]